MRRPLEVASDPDSYELAIEQYVYWRELGLSHRDMLQAVGIDHPHALGAETVVRCLAHAHRQLKLRRAA
jgi:hypothetical protein